MSRIAAAETVLARLERDGFQGVTIEAREALLIVKLRPEDQGRLLSDVPLREALIRQARDAGFLRIALELMECGNE